MNGGLRSSPSCLSCDSFLKEGNKGSIEYNREKKERIVYTAPFCLECLNKPDKINIPKIIKDLTEKGYWKKPEIKLLRKALRNFKKGNVQKKLNPDKTITYYSKERS